MSTYLPQAKKSANDGSNLEVQSIEMQKINCVSWIVSRASGIEPNAGVEPATF